MNRKIDMHKAAAVIIRNRKLLVSRSHGKDVFVAPGGKLEAGETSIEALIRELAEEQQITVQPSDLRFMGEFFAEAVGHDNVWLQMDVFYLDHYEGELTPSREIAENRWVDSADTTTPQGSIFSHEVIPRLVTENLID